VVGASPLAVRPRGVGDRGSADDHRQAREPERKAEETDVVGDAEIAEPTLAVLELQPFREVELPDDDEPEHDLRERDQGREHAERAARERQQPDEQRSRKRQEDQRRRH
jgi:hypothetical protein